jgi:membrane protease YdiL (CAAX protease family)
MVDTDGRRVRLSMELVGLYLLIPAVIRFAGLDRYQRGLLFLLTGLYAAAVLWRLKPSLAELGLVGHGRAQLRRCLSVYVLLVAGLLVIHLLAGAFPRFTVRGIVLIGLVYPLISVPLQELFFRSYFFLRYQDLVRPGVLGLLNVLLFAVYHTIYGGWLSLSLSLLGGTLLTALFLAYRRFWIVWVAHGILGLAVFLAGFGRHFTTLMQ